MKNFKTDFWFFAFCAVGTAADYIALAILTLMNVSKDGAFILAYIFGFMISFFLCRKFAFKVEDHVIRRIISTLIVHFFALAVQILFLNTLLNKMDLFYAKAINLVVNGILMYFLNKYVVFREYKTKKVSDKTWDTSSLIFGYFSPISKDLFSFALFNPLKIK